MTEDSAAGMERFRALGHSAFVMGYTGAAGKALVKELNKVKVFRNVVLIGRRVLPLDVGPEFEQKVVDYEKLDDSKDVFKDLHTGFCCLGVPSGGISRENYIRITLDYVLMSAQIAKDQGCKQFTVVTGQGVNKNSCFLFARVKGELEERLGELNFDRLSIYRPAYIECVRENTKTSESITKCLLKPFTLCCPTAFAIPDYKLAAAMINNAIRPIDPPVRELYENKEIHRLADDISD
uniref:NAD(P)-binding domain-containing protein n=1 Tax=Arion vulgaris TaxID=1028688 RepID=A0A0B7AL87_9EUPU